MEVQQAQHAVCRQRLHGLRDRGEVVVVVNAGLRLHRFPDDAHPHRVKTVGGKERRVVVAESIGGGFVWRHLVHLVEPVQHDHATVGVGQPVPAWPIGGAAAPPVAGSASGAAPDDASVVSAAISRPAATRLSRARRADTHRASNPD